MWLVINNNWKKLIFRQNNYKQIFLKLYIIPEIKYDFYFLYEVIDVQCQQEKCSNLLCWNI